jgi:glycosyltransferase involved in cell wall biosynthesis
MRQDHRPLTIDLPIAPTPDLSVSVAMCTWNGAAFIAQQLESIYQQEPPAAEIVISDDASTDRCIEIAEALAANQGLADDLPPSAPQLRVIRNAQPLGITKNFEQAVRACTGDLIALCDQDDAWHLGKLATMKAEFDRRPTLLLLHTDARLVDSAGGKISDSLFSALDVRSFELHWLHKGRGINVYMRRNLATGATTLFRRSLLDHALPFPMEWLHDEWLAAVAAALGGVDVLEAPLIDYRQHANNQVGARQRTLREKVAMAFAARNQSAAARVVKFEILLERLLALGDAVSPRVIALVRAKVAHQRFRATLPASRWRRCAPVLLEVLSGRYSRFGRVIHAVARDLLESA